MYSGLTELERELMESVFSRTPENDEGKLYDHQEEALKQLRGALAYMKEKYPGIRITYRMFDPLTRITEKGILICSAEGSEKTYRTVITADSGGYVYTDTLYSEFVSERYDAQLCGFLSPFVKSVKTHTVFSTPAGTEVNAQMSADELLAYEPVLIRHTDIRAAQPLSDRDQLIALLKENRYFGSYTYFSPEDSAAQDSAGSEPVNFNVFERMYSEGENA